MKPVDFITEFSGILLKNNYPVSDVEYTNGNYDNNGKELMEPVPTITTDCCEIGCHGSEAYFVFIMESKYFNDGFFCELNDRSNFEIYTLSDFNTTLYPKKDFDYQEFIRSASIDPYLQIQFDFDNKDASALFIEYEAITAMFLSNNVSVINQMTDWNKS